MIFSSSSPSDQKPMAIFALALGSSIFCAACADEATPPIYLGVLDGGTTTPDSDIQDSSIPTLNNLDTPTACKSDPISGPDVASTVKSASGASARLLLTVNKGITALKLDALGCPSGPVPGFGTNGFVEIAAVASVPLAAGRSLIATESELQVLDSEGKKLIDCTGSIPSRLLAIRSDGSGYAGFARSPLQEITIKDTPSCTLVPLALKSEPYLIAALAPVDPGGFVLAEQDSPAAALRISRYDSTGTRIVSSPNPADKKSPAYLCSVSGIVQTQAGIVVTDATCKRLVVFDDNLIPVSQRAFEQTPRGVAALDDPSKVLVVLTAPTSSGAEASFVTVSLTVSLK